MTDTIPLEPRSQRTQRFPQWLKRPLSQVGKAESVEAVLTDASLHTVCREAKCPNMGECFSRGTATFLVMGSICSRSCSFCGVQHGIPSPLDPSEPARVCDAIEKMKLSHAVITSVTRDDIPDGGASHFAEIISLIRKRLPQVTIEVLVPDFRGNTNALESVLFAGPHVFNHNIETIPRLYQSVRPQASYGQSLEILAYASRFRVDLRVKSGLMVGLGETREEIFATMSDLLAHGCTLLTIGQYLQPSKHQTPVIEFITPGQFDEYKNHALDLGFSDVAAGPFVRSSYMAERMITKV